MDRGACCVGVHLVLDLKNEGVVSKDAKLLMAAMAGLGTLLPGDRIHDIAPISERRRQDPGEAMAQIAAAQAKRERKAKKTRSASDKQRGESYVDGQCGTFIGESKDKTLPPE